MFSKKIQIPILNSMQRQAIRTQMDQKAINHEFFLLVREHKYQDALELGLTFLQYHPENAAISKFCYFIQQNKDKLNQMVDEEQNGTDESESDDDDEDDEGSDDQDQQQENKKSILSKVPSTSAVHSKKPSLNIIKPVNQNIIKIIPNLIKPRANSITPPSLTHFPSQKSQTFSKTQKKATSVSILPRIGKICTSKQNIQICKGHRWSHNCKNPGCPNRNK